VFLVAREHCRSVGCGALRTFAQGIGEIGHLWVDSEARGIGLSRRLLRELESQAVALGHRLVRLDTHEALTEAINLYQSSGYTEVPAYDDNAHSHHWFEKALTASTGG
jgi:ribosomal protein S18 acetylase RimI-like enzyme